MVGEADFKPVPCAGDPCIVLSFGAAFGTGGRAAAATLGVRGVVRAWPAAVPGLETELAVLEADVRGFRSAADEVVGRLAGVADVEERIDERRAEVIFGGSSIELEDGLER